MTGVGDWSGLRVLVTGHTGFKGAWLCTWLAHLGAEVHGLALDPPAGGLFVAAEVASLLASDIRGDISDAAVVDGCLQTVEPEVVIHMAAQPLVRESYRQPRETFVTNVVGTVNVITGAIRTSSVRAVVSVTTDKVYRNVERVEGYREDDPLGGHDPYSASKACADLATSSLAASFPRPRLAIATARSGNVIGGGDTAPDRMVPDLLRAFAAGVPAQVRNPNSVRPWQHVLDPLAGYMTLAQALLTGRGEGAWNFGPVEPPCDVATLADMTAHAWGGGAIWIADDGEHPHEAGLLCLDPSKAMRELGWRPRLDIETCVAWTVAFERRQMSQKALAHALMLTQISEYASLSN
jgi:CDP-glucose 4,6-dehydratase